MRRSNGCSSIADRQEWESRGRLLIIIKKRALFWFSASFINCRSGAYRIRIRSAGRAVSHRGGGMVEKRSALAQNRSRRASSPGAMAARAGSRKRRVKFQFSARLGLGRDASGPPAPPPPLNDLLAPIGGNCGRIRAQWRCRWQPGNRPLIQVVGARRRRSGADCARPIGLRSDHSRQTAGCCTIARDRARRRVRSAAQVNRGGGAISRIV